MFGNGLSALGRTDPENNKNYYYYYYYYYYSCAPMYEKLMLFIGSSTVITRFRLNK